MRWMPIGVCFWLRCSWRGCRVRTSLKVGHYNPDLVVSAYNELGGNPWVEIRASLGLAQVAAATGLLGELFPVPIDSAGNRTEGSSNNRDHRNLVFRETDAIGHPLSSLSGLVAGVGLLCPSEATSFFPYFQSGLDALAWRQEVPEIFCSPSRLNQVFINVVTNAVQAMDGEGTLRISTRFVPNERGDSVEIAFEDTGCGIEEEELEHIFDRFYRNPRSKEGQEDSTGLGLAITKRLVALMGGDIEVSSTPGQGASFRFTIRLGRSRVADRVAAPGI